MKVDSISAVGAIRYIPEIKPLSKAERLMRTKMKEKIEAEKKIHEMIEATRRWAKPDWLGKYVDFYV
jgi:hypothetical protein